MKNIIVYDVLKCIVRVVVAALLSPRRNDLRLTSVWINVLILPSVSMWDILSVSMLGMVEDFKEVFQPTL